MKIVGCLESCGNNFVKNRSNKLIKYKMYLKQSSLPTFSIYATNSLSTDHFSTFTGIRSSYASQHSQLGQDFRSAMSPDRHIAPIYEERTFQGPLYRSPSHTKQGTLYRSASGLFNVIYNNMIWLKKRTIIL